MTEAASGPPDRGSQHPVDQLIRGLIHTGRQATPEEIDRIIDRMATVPFNPGTYQVPLRDRGLAYRGRTLGARVDALTYHLAKRVSDRQWAENTTPAQYIQDLRRAVRAPDARLAVYLRRGGPIAATLTPTSTAVPTAGRTLASLPEMLVIYSADRGIILSGYQASRLEATGVPQEARWLK